MEELELSRHSFQERWLESGWELSLLLFHLIKEKTYDFLKSQLLLLNVIDTSMYRDSPVIFI